MSATTNGTRRPSVALIAGIAVLLGIFAAVMFGPATTVKSWIIILAHYSAWVVVPVVVVGAAGFAAYCMLAADSAPSAHRRGYGYETVEEKREREAAEAAARAADEKLRPVGYVLAAFAVVGVFATAWFWVSHGHGTNQVYLAGVEVVETAAPSYEDRIAYPTAKASLPKNMQGLRGDITDPTYVDGQWTSVVTYKGSFKGTQAVLTWSSPLVGEGTYEVCKFGPGAERKLGGYFGASLTREIRKQVPGVMVDDQDAYGYCVNGAPSLVVPLKDVVGWAHPHQVPGGVAVMDKDGVVTIHRSVESGQFPGPVYPSSLAKRQREATAGMGSMTDQWFNRAGYEKANEASGMPEADDPNGSNAGELALVGKDGRTYLDTPLSSRGADTSITAEAVLDATSVEAGKFSPLVVHQFKKARTANKEVADDIRGDYRDLEWASGLKIFEVTPVDSKTWVVSLGQTLDILYRVRVNADGTSCLEDADGTQLRCGAPKNNGTTPATTGGTVPGNDSELVKLSDQELIDLLDRANAEVQRRLSSK